jgi:SAM-dependent methyltransferase
MIEPEHLPSGDLPPAVRAFDATAPRFDERFGAWASVAAQRGAVRRHLVRIFPAGSRLLELGGGTGEDALYLLERGYRVTLTDGSPAMVELGAAKVRSAGFTDARVEHLVLEDMTAFERRSARAPFDGVYSNFASLNCVRDLRVLGPPLARLVRPGGACAFVMFGTASIGEIVVELARGRPRAAFRRLRRGPAPAKLGGHSFDVWYPSPRRVARSLEPWLRLRATRGIGIFVPPSAAEPWISRFPRLVSVLASADRVSSAPLALLGDHVLLHFERTAEPAPDL